MNALYQGGRASRAMLLLACVGSFSYGCSFVDRRPKLPIDSAAGLYDQAKVEYKLDAGQLNLPLAVTRVEGQLVSYDQVPSAPRRDTSVGTLSIEYPHPEGRAGYARARLEISSHAPAAASEQPEAADASAWSKLGQQMNPRRLLTSTGAKPSPGVDETWELDIPRSYLDAAVTSLDRSGYFDSRQKGAEGVEINARVDGRNVRKSWQQVPELNELMVAIRNQGRLVAYSRPAKDGLSTFNAASLASYQRYQEQDRLAEQTARSQYLAQAQAGGGYATQPAGAGAFVAQSPSAPPVVPYFGESQAAGVAPAANVTAGAATSGQHVATAQGWGGQVPAPRDDSLPWRNGSRTAPTTQAELEPQPRFYPETGYGAAPQAMPSAMPNMPPHTAPAPAAAPHTALQPSYPSTPY